MVAMGLALGLLGGGLWLLLTTPLEQPGMTTTASEFYELGSAPSSWRWVDEMT